MFDNIIGDKGDMFRLSESEQMRELVEHYDLASCVGERVPAYLRPNGRLIIHKRDNTHRDKSFELFSVSYAQERRRHRCASCQGMTKKHTICGVGEAEIDTGRGLIKSVRVHFCYKCLRALLNNIIKEENEGPIYW